MRRATAWIDGGVRTTDGRTGPYAYAAVLEDANGVLEFSGHGTNGTNNRAEYEGLLLALRSALSLGVTHVIVFSDSKLIVEQVLGSWRVREPSLRPLHQDAQNLACEFEEVRISHVPREENKRADALCTSILDNCTGRKRGSN